jgi:hypothetical protein
VTLPPGTKVVFASQDNVARYEEQVDALLEILGHSESWVSDESSLSDFAYTQHELNLLLRTGGIELPLSVGMTLVEAIETILQDNPNWPKPRSVQ